MIPKTAHMYQRAKELQAQAQLLLGWAAQARVHAIRVRHDARLGRLKRRMPQANPLTWVVTAAILDAHGLWEGAPKP
jgi:hypothetical protein